MATLSSMRVKFAALALMTSWSAGVMSCKAKLTAQVASNCAKPTDANCKKTSGGTASFPNSKSLDVNSNQPTITWDAAISVSGGPVEYYSSLDPAEPDRAATGQSTLEYKPSGALSDGAYTLYVWTRESKNKLWSPYTKISFSVDTTAPTVASVTSMTSDATYAAGSVIDIQIAFSEAVTVTGSPQLTLSSGGTATYVSGSGTSQLVFTYTVASTDIAADLDVASAAALTANGGAIKDAAGNDATLTLPTGSDSGSLSGSRAIVIAGNAARVTSVSSSTGNGSYKAGQSVTITVTFSAAVNVTGTPRITLETGATDQTVNYVSGTGTTTLSFTYTVAAGDTSADLDYVSVNALALNSGTIVDATTSTAAILTLPAVGGASSIAGQKAIVIDTTAPALTFTSTTPSSPGSSQTPSVSFNLTEATATNGLRLYSDSGCTTTPISAATTGTSGSNSVTTTSLTANVPTAIYGLATDLAGNPSACTSLVTYTHDNVGPSLSTFARTGGASVNALPVSFSVTFSEAITAASFTAGDVSNLGTATGVTWTVTDTGDHTTFTVSATVSGIGTLQPRIAVSGVSDPAGNVNAANIDSTNAVSYSNATYSVTVNQAGGQADPINGVPINFTVVFSSAVAGGTFTTADITQNGTATGITWSLSSGNNITWTLAATAVTGAGTLIPSIGGGLVTDAFGNTNTASTATDNSVTYDTTAPTVTNVSSSLGNGSYKINQVVPVTVTFSKSVTVTGTPQITLDTGGGGDVVNYSSGSPGTILTFNYTVGSGDTSSDLDYPLTTSLALNSGTIQDAAGNNATLTLPAVGGGSSIAGQKAIVIDTTDPTITATSVTTTSPGRTQTPGVQFTLNEAATVTLYSDSGCSTTAISSGTSLASGVRTMTTNSLSANVPTTIYGLAADAAGNSSSCTTIGSYTNDLTAPGTPTGLTATPSSGQVALSWTASTGSPSGYIVIRHTAAITGGPTDGTDYAATNSVGNGTVVYANTTNSYTDTGLTNGTTYYYAVRAKDSALNWSAAATTSSTPSAGGGGAGGNTATRYMFVSAVPNSGNLGPSGVNNTPTYQADLRCKNAATNGFAASAISPGTNWSWNAMLGIYGQNMRTRAALPASVSFKDVVNATIATSEAQLFNDASVSLTTAFNLDEDGNGANANVWTGASLSATCSNWTTNSGGVSGQVGLSSQTDATWQMEDTHTCNNSRGIYCITTPPAYVFVTSTTYNGNFGGEAGADSACATRAAAGSASSTLGVTRWRAVVAGGAVGGSNFTARQRLSIPLNTTFLLVDNSTIVAANEGVFFNDNSQALANVINKDENGATLNSATSWVGTPPEGCNNGTNYWSRSDSGNYATTGNNSNTDINWYRVTPPTSFTCDQTHHLYCVGQ